MAKFDPDEFLAKTPQSAFDPDSFLAKTAPAPAPEPTESGGFFGSYKQALKERATTAAPAAQIYFNAGDQKAAVDELLKRKDEANAVYKQTEFSDIGQAFKEGRFGDALGGTLDKFKEVAGSSLGSQTPAIAAGLGSRVAAGLALPALGVAAVPAAAIGTAAWGLTTLGSYIADNIARQKEEQEKKGKKYEDVNRLDATVAGAGSTALDAFGFSYFKPLGRLVGLSGKESAEKAAMEIVQAATQPKAYRKAVARGAAEGIAFEVPQEVAQSVLERWQAGLALDPFKDPGAAKEYLEAAGGAMLLGGPMGAYSRGVDTYKARQTPEGQAMLRTGMPNQLIQDLEGEGNVNQPISPAGGASPAVVSEPNTGAPAGGPSVSQPGGMDVAGQTTAGLTEGAANAPEALTPPAPTGGSMTNFRDAYTALREEILPLLGGGLQDPQTDVQRNAAMRDLNRLVDEHAAQINDTNLIKNLKNPMFDGTREVTALVAQEEAGQSFGSQGNLFGKFINGARAARVALASAGQDTANALKYLEDRRQRLLDRQKNGELDAAWAQQIAGQFGMTQGEAAKNPQAVADQYVQNTLAEIDQAAAELQRRGQSKASQGDLFANQDEKDVDSLMEALEGKRPAKVEPSEREQFGAPLPGEENTVEAPPAMEPVSQKETVVAPETNTEHARETAEGKQLTDFVTSLAPASTEPGEILKHASLRRVLQDAMLEFDISKPGETASAGLKKILDYLHKRVGSPEAFQKLLSQLSGADPATQRELLSRNNLPDLTSRRGMEEFNGQMQQAIDDMGKKGEGVQVPTKNIPSKQTGEFKGVIPFTAEVVSVTKRAQEHAASPEGKPRRPGVVNVEKKYIVQDTKLRTAWRNIKQMIAARGTPSAEALAAKNYMENPKRDSFGDVLNDLAYDLAHFELDPRNNGANSTFYGEGGKYAVNFQKWINANLDPSTVETLNNLVADYKQDFEENQKFNAAVTKYNAALDRYAEKQRKEAEERLKLKIPKAPKEKQTVSGVVEGIEDTGEEKVEEPKVSKRGLPREQKLTEIHPAIVRMLREDNLKGALEVLANAKNNNYYALLAQRLLDAGVDSKVQVVKKGHIEPLTNTAINVETFKSVMENLRTMVQTSFDATSQAEILELLNSKDLDDIRRGAMAMNAEISRNPDKFNANRVEIFNGAIQYLNEQYSWNAKFDPFDDTITMREGHLTNTTLLHETLHAATAKLIDKPDSLQGIPRQGYDQLMELYNYSKGILSAEGMDIDHIYGLSNLHEFVSEAMTNPEFQAQLRAIRYKAAPFSLWNAFTTGIRKLFNIKPGRESNVLFEAMMATDAMMAGPMSIEGMVGKTEAKGTKGKLLNTIPQGLRNSPGTIQKLMTSNSWNDVKSEFPSIFSTATAGTRPKLLGALTLRQIDDLVRNRIPQVGNFIRVTERFLARKNNILRESGKISEEWFEMQKRNPEMSRNLAKVMHAATLRQFDPDPKVATTAEQKAANKDVAEMWKKLDPQAKSIYRDVRKFYEDRYAEYKNVMQKRIKQMRELGVSEATITEIRNEFEQAKRKGPYFPLMRHGRFWYQIGEGATREYYMFETRGQKEAHMAERIKRDPTWVIKEGSEYAQQMDLHAKQSTFLQNAFRAIDNATFTGINGDVQRQTLKDSIYQNFLANQPEYSFRSQFVHRNNIAGYSEDALRNFAASSFHMAYQLARFENSPDMFSQIDAARVQIKDRFDADKGYDQKVSRENNELSDYVTEMDRRLKLMLNPTDVGTIPTLLSNIGFIWYLTSPASAITNVLGGMIIGLPTLVGMNVRMNPNMSYTQATLNALGQMRKVAGQVMSTGYGNKKDGYYPSLDRYDGMSAMERQAYDRFVADGVIDITAAYDQSGLASAPTDDQFSIQNKAMTALTSLFHNAERFNREVMAMSAFRQAMEARKGYKDQTLAMEESILEAKDITNRSMFDYSAANKPRYFQHPLARVVLQFKQFPQQMTFFLAHNAINMWKGQTPEVRREARARFIGTMGMAGIFSGVTGLWGFSTVAGIMNAVINGLSDEEEPFDFELEFVNWAMETFGQNLGTMLTRGIGNAAGIDLASRTKLDDMWFQDSRKNQDEVEALQSFLVNLLGPTVGLTINVAEAAKLWNEGHADRAIEKISPAFIKNPLVAARYANEGVNTLAGDPLVEDMGSFHLLMQSLGIRSAELAERQYYNIQIKGQEQAVLKERQNLLNLFGIAMIANDSDSVDKALNKIEKFNNKHPSVYIPSESIVKSIDNRMKKSAETDHGLFIDKRMRNVLDSTSYLD